MEVLAAALVDHNAAQIRAMAATAAAAEAEGGGGASGGGRAAPALKQPGAQDLDALRAALQAAGVPQRLAAPVRQV